ncbi:MAG TPA: DNA-binding response regulator, partial [Cytophagales bacterium]|nr:DNA-binding response regulator [Cytophagales bacterium]
EQQLTIPVLMLTMHAGLKPLRTALSYGVGGYVLKNATQDVLVEAITQVAGGGNYFHQPI